MSEVTASWSRFSLIALCALSACNWSNTPKPHSVNPMSGESLFADVQQYEAFGIHRAGTEGDRNTTEWVGRELARAGFEVNLDPIRFNHFDLEFARFEMTGESLECLPFWFPTATNGPVRAPLALIESEDLIGKIAVAQSSGTQWKLDPTDLALQAQEKGALALAIVVPSPSGHVAAQNARAPFNQAPRGLPIMNLAWKHLDTVLEGAKNGTEATLEIRGESNPNGKTENIVAKKVGSDEWIVITTPLTGWYTCAGERGPGVALFVGLARWLADQDLPSSVMFLGNAGHELDHLGAGNTLEHNAPKPEEVKAWIHLGASIGTRDIQSNDAGELVLSDEANAIGNLVATEALLPQVTEAFSNVSFLKPRSTEPINGELRDFINAGYNAFGFFGGCYYFHTPYDTDVSTTPELLDQVATALKQFLLELE